MKNFFQALSLHTKNVHKIFCNTLASFDSRSQPDVTFTLHKYHNYSKGTVPSKNDQIKKNPSNEVSTCSRCCCGISQLCDV